MCHWNIISWHLAAVGCPTCRLLNYQTAHLVLLMDEAPEDCRWGEWFSTSSSFITWLFVLCLSVTYCFGAWFATSIGIGWNSLLWSMIFNLHIPITMTTWIQTHLCSSVTFQILSYHSWFTVYHPMVKYMATISHFWVGLIIIEYIFAVVVAVAKISITFYRRNSSPLHCTPVLQSLLFIIVGWNATL